MITLIFSFLGVFYFSDTKMELGAVHSSLSESERKLLAKKNSVVIKDRSVKVVTNTQSTKERNNKITKNELLFEIQEFNKQVHECNEKIDAIEQNVVLYTKKFADSCFNLKAYFALRQKISDDTELFKVYSKEAQEIQWVDFNNFLKKYISKITVAEALSLIPIFEDGIVRSSIILEMHILTDRLYDLYQVVGDRNISDLERFKSEIERESDSLQFDMPNDPNFQKSSDEEALAFFRKEIDFISIYSKRAEDIFQKH